ncbi:MAG: DUF2339 domain-containing protein [Flavobacterium sp.]|jgi:hypothetical protein|uniref:DUF2339 domain-containing protein n=2 Tax=Flavobacterium sp. TaxID=239 RepID=UPI0022BF800D|nr:hypothetical protein [Flavobacterium sp.]MCZ8168133.1 hypothetical protein [Flavobacterium sp.]MCZ8296178.1 hypothetical protein [Flavobacterium sp.]
MEFIVFVLFILVIFGVVKFQSLKSSVDVMMTQLFKLAGDRDSLQQQVNALREELQQLKSQPINATPVEIDRPIEAPEPPQPMDEEPAVAPVLPEEVLSLSEPEVVEEFVQEAMPETTAIAAFSTPKITETAAQPTPYIPPVPPEPSALFLFFKKWERQFADNWTGILGTAIMVLGVGYLSIYTALKVSPLFRVLIIWAYAGLLMGSYLLLKKKPLWEKTGLWLRSAGASLFLFGCFGASQIPALQFIEQTTLGYGLLVIGIGLNLWIGYRIKRQTFLSLHVVLSMLILCVIPEKLLLTFLLAAGTATVGILLSYKEKWEYHILSVIGSFLVFDVWFNMTNSSLTHVENKIAILGIVGVAVSCMLMQYRKLYDHTAFDKAGLTTHLVNWGLFATGLLMHATGSKFKTIVVALGAAVCFWASRVAKKRGITWLYHVDFLVSFSLLSFTIITLNEWNVGLAILFLGLTLTFNLGLLFTHLEQQDFLHRILKIGYHVYIGFSLLISLKVVVETNDYGIWLYGLIAHSLLVLGLHVYSLGTAKWKSFDAFYGLPSVALNGLFAVGLQLLLVALVYHQTTHNLFVYVLLGAALLWTVLLLFRSSLLLNLGRILFFILAGIEVIYLTLEGAEHWIDGLYLLALALIAGLQWRKPEWAENRFFVRFTLGLVTTLFLIVVNFKYGDYQPLFSTLGFFGLAFGLVRIVHHLIQSEPNELELAKFFKILYGLTFLCLLYYVSSEVSSFSWVEMVGCFGIGLALPLVSLGLSHRFALRYPATDPFLVSKTHEAFALFLITQSIGFWVVPSPYAIIYFGAIPGVYFIMYEKSNWFEPLRFFAFLQLIFSFSYSCPELIEVIGLYDPTTALYYSIGFLFALGYGVLQFRSKQLGGSEHLVKTIYVLNLFLLLFGYRSIEELYFGLALMSVALCNYYLSFQKNIGLHRFVPDGIALLGLIVSLLYALTPETQFKGMEWLVYTGVYGLAWVWIVVMQRTSLHPMENGWRQILVNIWVSALLFSQLDQKWMPFYWAVMAVIQLYLVHRKVTFHTSIPLIYYMLANLHLGILGFWYYHPDYLPFYLGLMGILGVFVGYAYRILDSFPLKNSLLIYPVTLSIGLFLYLTFDKGALTFFWVLEALGLLVLSITLKEKYFRYVSLAVVGLCIVRLMFFDLSNTDFLIRALVLLGVGVVLLVMNSLFKKYKDRLD